MSKEAYDKMYGRPLTPIELSEVQANLRGFFELLIEIDREQKEAMSHAEV